MKAVCILYFHCKGVKDIAALFEDTESVMCDGIKNISISISFSEVSSPTSPGTISLHRVELSFLKIVINKDL